MPIPDHQKALIIKLAERLRGECVGPDGNLLGRCDVLAEKLRDALLEEGVTASQVVGSFRVDHDLREDLARYYSCAHRARHVWLEVHGYIVDATADQFNEFLITPMEDIVIGVYDEHPRYVKDGPWPVREQEDRQTV